MATDNKPQAIQRIVVNGTPEIYQEAIAGSGKFPTRLDVMPSNVTEVFRGTRLDVPWTPSPIREFKPVTFSFTNYGICINMKPSNLTHAQWIAKGNKLISNFQQQAAAGNDWTALPSANKFCMYPEGAILGIFRGHKFFSATPEQIEQQIWSVIPTGGTGSFFCPNIESSLDWRREYYDTDQSGIYPSWNSGKGDVIKSMVNGQTMTMEQMYNHPTPNFWLYETQLRLCVYLGFILKAALAKGFEFVAMGASIIQGDARKNMLTPGYVNRFRDTGMRVDQLNGYTGNNTVVLNGRTYSGMTGSFWKFETYHQNYDYPQTFTYTGTKPYNQITSYEELWANMDMGYRLALELGKSMANDFQFLHPDVHNGNTIPQMRQFQDVIEGQPLRPTGIAMTGYDGKVHYPPVDVRTIILASHFYQGERRGAGAYFFTNLITNLALGNGVLDMNHLATHSNYNMPMHSVEAIFAAEKDLEPYQWFLANSIRTMQLDIRRAGTEVWDNINPIVSNGQEGGGGFSARFPTAGTRHYVAPDGLYILAVAQNYQKHTESSVIDVRIPNVMTASGNVLRITCYGKDTMLKWFFIPNGVTNKVFEADSNVPAWAKAGYGGITYFAQPPPVVTPTSDMLAYSDQGWTDSDLRTLENSVVKFQFRKSIGGVLWWAGLKSTGNNMIQTHLRAAGIWDTGRSYGGAWYFSPTAGNLFCISGVCTGTNPDPNNRGGIGNNPVWGGGINIGDGSPVLKSAFVQTQDRGTVFCTQVRPKQWDFTNVLGHMLLNNEFWIQADDTLGHIMEVVVEERPAGYDQPTAWAGLPTEEPGLYIPADHHVRSVKVNGAEVNKYPESGSPQNYYTDDYAIYSGNDTSEGITLYTPENNCMGSSRPNPEFGTSGGPTDNACGYMQAKIYRNLDCPGRYRQTIFTILGSRAAAKARIATLPQPNTSFDFDFTNINSHQHGWSSGPEAFKVENGEWTLYIGQGHTDQNVTSYRARISSPYRRWAASSLATLEVTAKLTAGSGFLITWHKVNSSGGLDEFQKSVTFAGDGLVHTITIPMAGTGNWTGILNQVSIQVKPGTPDAAKFKPRRIRNV